MTAQNPPPKRPGATDPGYPPIPEKPHDELPIRRTSILQAFFEYGWVLLVILAVALYVRSLNPNYSSAFMDESVYVVYGRMFLTGQFEAPLDQPLHFSFGWYLWPALAATADRIGGLAGVRELAAALGALTVLGVYGFARRLFSPAVGLASAAIFALLGPAVLASRIATRDSGAICFFALGLWLYVRAWQEKESGTWLAAGLCFFAAFLCKYLVAIFFPFLALLTLWKRWRAVLFYALPLTLLCGGYAYWYAGDLGALLQYASAYGSLKAPAHDAWRIYFIERIDFWVLVLLALAAWKWKRDTPRQSVIWLLWGGAAALFTFQLYSRADYDYWKHINYALLFVVPLAMEGLLRLVRGLSRANFQVVGFGAVGVLAVALGWSGDAWQIDRNLFWPNVEPIVAFFEGRLTAENRVLLDDTVLRYYLHPTLKQSRMTDPYYYRYGDETGTAAYSAAVGDGYFDYVALDGGMGEEAHRMRAAILPKLASRYTLLIKLPDSNLHQDIEIYERTNPPPAAPAAIGPQIEILAPASQAVVRTTNARTVVQGVAREAGPGWFVLTDVYTNRWYPQGGKVYLGGVDSAFSVPIYLAGEGSQQCQHLVRVQLYDNRGRRAAASVLFGVVRANADGSRPNCP